jgi:hypothetical protein
MPLAGAVVIAAIVSGAVPTLPPEAAGWRAAAPADGYDARTIFRYLDGLGEVYLAYGMVACHARRYAGPDGEGDVVVDVFEMASPEDAFGVFTHSREGAPVDVGRGAAYGYGTLFFWKGRYFVSVQAESETGPARAAVLALGRAVAAGLAEAGGPPPLVGRLPRPGLEEGSIVWLRHPRILEAHVPVGPDNPLGVGPRHPAVTARYRVEGGSADLVVVEYADAASATQAAAAFGRRFLDAGRPARHDDGWCAAVDLGDRARAYVLRAPSREAAEALAAEAGKGGRP